MIWVLPGYKNPQQTQNQLHLGMLFGLVDADITYGQDFFICVNIALCNENFKVLISSIPYLWIGREQKQQQTSTEKWTYDVC